MKVFKEKEYMDIKLAYYGKGNVRKIGESYIVFTKDKGWHLPKYGNKAPAITEQSI